MSLVNSRITAFFKPHTKQVTNPTKRSLPEEDITEPSRKRSKSPHLLKGNISPLPIRTDSPNSKRVSSPFAVVQPNAVVDPLSDTSDLSALTPSDSDPEDTIVLQRDYKSPTRTLFPQSSAGSAINQSFTSSVSSSHRIERFGETIVTGSDDDDSDELLDLDQLLGRESVKAKPSDQSGHQRPVTRKAKGKKKVTTYRDTSKDDEARFLKLMEQTKKDSTKHDDTQEAIKLVRELETQELKASYQSKQTRSDYAITCEKIMSRVGDLDAEKAERFAQAMQRTELTHTSNRWSFFNASNPSIQRPNSLHEDKTPKHSQSLPLTSSFVIPCQKCGKRGLDMNYARRAFVCHDCGIWQHSSCADDLNSETETQSFVFKCKACQTSQGSTRFAQSLKASSTRRTRLQWPDIKDQPGWSIYQDSDQRDLAFVCGVFEQTASDGQLPEEIYLWILRESFGEPRQQLRQAYQSILKLAELSVSSDQAITHLQLGLEQLGASDEAIVSSDAIQKESTDPAQTAIVRAPQDMLKAWFQNAANVSKCLSGKDKVKLLDLLLTLTLDSAMPFNPSILVELQSALIRCIDCFDNTDMDAKSITECLQKLFHRAGDVHYRFQCCNILPGNTTKACQVRRRLALATFFEDPSVIQQHCSAISLQDLKQHLDTDRQFQMTSKTDYRKVAALFGCLDIGIGDGNAPQSTEPEVVKDFNATVDELAETIQIKFAKIQANGAAHISRTETKDTLETIESRLIYAIRTKRKPKRNIYDQQKLESMFQKQ